MRWNVAKTYEHLYRQVVSFDNLYLAYRAAARGYIPPRSPHRFDGMYILS